MKKKKKVFIQVILNCNKTVLAKFDRKWSFNLLKLMGVMMALYSRHSSTLLNLKSALVSIKMKVVKRTEQIRVW